jgi:hypothetical protein
MLKTISQAEDIGTDHALYYRYWKMMVAVKLPYELPMEMEINVS